MKKLLLSLLVASTAMVGAANAGSIVIRNQGANIINVWVENIHSDHKWIAFQMSPQGLGGDIFKMNFGDEPTTVSVQPVTGLHGETHYFIGPDKYQHIDYAGFFSGTMRNEYTSPWEADADVWTGQSVNGYNFETGRAHEPNYECHEGVCDKA